MDNQNSNPESVPDWLTPMKETTKGLVIMDKTRIACFLKSLQNMNANVVKNGIDATNCSYDVTINIEGDRTIIITYLCMPTQDGNNYGLPVDTNYKYVFVGNDVYINPKIDQIVQKIFGRERGMNLKFNKTNVIILPCSYELSYNKEDPKQMGVVNCGKYRKMSLSKQSQKVIGPGSTKYDTTIYKASLGQSSDCSPNPYILLQIPFATLVVDPATKSPNEYVKFITKMTTFFNKENRVGVRTSSSTVDDIDRVLGEMYVAFVPLAAPLAQPVDESVAQPEAQPVDKSVVEEHQNPSGQSSPTSDDYVDSMNISCADGSTKTLSVHTLYTSHREEEDKKLYKIRKIQQIRIAGKESLNYVCDVRIYDDETNEVSNPQYDTTNNNQTLMLCSFKPFQNNVDVMPKNLRVDTCSIQACPNGQPVEITVGKQYKSNEKDGSILYKIIHIIKTNDGHKVITEARGNNDNDEHAPVMLEESDEAEHAIMCGLTEIVKSDSENTQQTIEVAQPVEDAVAVDEQPAENEQLAEDAPSSVVESPTTAEEPTGGRRAMRTNKTWRLNNRRKTAKKARRQLKRKSVTRKAHKGRISRKSRPK